MNNQELVEYRKINYWRGFRFCLLITLPVIIFFIVVTNLLINIVE